MISNDIQKAIDDSIEKAKFKNSLGSFIATALEERVSDPLWRSYVFFLITLNWQAVVTLFVENVDKTKSKVELISSILKNKYLFDESCTIGGYAYLINPAILTILFILYLWLGKPFFKGLFTYFKDKANKKEKENEDTYTDKYLFLKNQKDLLDLHWINKYKALQEYLKYLKKNYQIFTDQDFETYNISEKIELNKVFKISGGKDIKVIYIYEIYGEKNYLIDITNNKETNNDKL